MGEIRTLGDACSHIVDCAHRTAPIDEKGEYWAVGTPAMRGNRIDYQEARRINARTFAEWTMRLRPQPGDLLLAREAPVGPVVRIPESANVAPGQRTVLLRAREENVESRFLYFYLASPVVQAELQVKAAGSTVAHLNVADIRQFPTPGIPSLPDQRAIAEVLGALDDKIAANDKALVAADELIRSEFESLKGGLKRIGEVADNVRVQVDPSKTTPDTQYVGLEHIPRRRMWLTEQGRATDVTSQKSAFDAGDVLFGKLRPYFHKVVRAPIGGLASTDILVVRAKDASLAGYVLAAVSSDAAIRATSASAEGTRMPRTKWGDLSQVAVPWPGEEDARAFSGRVDAIAHLAAGRAAESAKLSSARDGFLPLLMSGKVRVKDAAKVAEEVL